MARETLARAQPIDARVLKTRHKGVISIFVSREVFEKRKFFILWIWLRMRMDSRNRSFSRMGASHPFLEFVQHLELELDSFPRIAFTAEAP
jgi:hypothetical protein